LASRLELGDNFAVNVEEGNEKDVNFYLVLCTQSIRTHCGKGFYKPVENKIKKKEIVLW
jgi:hypothetical protein